MITKKQEKALREYVRVTPPEDVAWGMGSTDVLKAGPYRLLPLVGTVRRTKSGAALVVQGLLLKVYADKNEGLLNWKIPLSEGTLGSALELLAALGWDGRVWPSEAGWPDSDPWEAKGLHRMLGELGLKGSMVFPPVAGKGTRTLRVLVSKSGMNLFPLPPTVEAEDRLPIPSEWEAKLRVWMVDPSIFTEEVTDLLPAPRWLNPHKGEKTLGSSV